MTKKVSDQMFYLKHMYTSFISLFSQKKLNWFP